MHERVIGVGVVGAGWLGDVHARAWARLRHHYADLGVHPRFVAVADSVPAALENARRKHGFEKTYLDWRDLVTDPEIDAISVTAPNALHREIGVAVAEAGKHLWIEKPVGLSPEDARAVAEAVDGSGVQGTVGFNYRSVPAVVQLRDLVVSGAIGTPTHAHVQMLTDYAAHPLGLLTWRYTLAAGGHGVLGDLASHAVDLTRFVLGDIERLVAETATFVPERPVLAAGAATYGHGLGHEGDPTGPVENEDFVTALMRTSSGALTTLECSRVAVGEQNRYGIEVHGTRGLVAWDFRTPGELRVSTGTAFVDQPSQRLLVGPDAGDHGRFQPGAGIALSYDDTKVVELGGFVRAILAGKPEGPVLADAVASAEVLDAMVRSAAGAGWVAI
ncbi:MAG: Gfo/Idh/MocA family oxidoreductase [Nocardioidaceae bacterium]